MAATQQTVGDASKVTFSAHPSPALYVGNLSPDVQENNLYEKFGNIGPIASVRVCRDSVSRRSLGYAYVNFTNVEHAKTAVETLNAEVLLDRPMRVMFSNRDPTLRRSGVGNIYISNLNKTIDTKQLLDTLAQFGNILSVKISSDSRTGESRGYGFVHFSTEAEALAAIKALNGMTLEGNTITVQIYKTKMERSRDLEKNFTNIFIKNLPPTFDEAQLEGLFGQFGKISRSTVRKNNDGASKGYAFVEFVDHAAAQAAVEKLTDYQVDSEHKLLVQRALKKSERTENMKRMMRTDRQQQNQNNLYVKNLDDTVTDEELRKMFGPYGSVKSVRIMRDDNGRSKGFGFVSFDTQEAATKAATELNCKFVGSKPLYVAKFQSRQERSQHLAMVFRQPAHMPYGPNYYFPPQMVMSQYPPSFPGARRMPAVPGPQQRPFGPRPGGPGANFPMGARPPRPAMPMQQAPNAGPLRTNTKPNASQPTNRRGNEDSAFAATLASMAPAEQKNMIGERLYSGIVSRHGPKAGKITGMLLEMDISELLHLLDDPEALLVKEKEALKVLTDHKA